MKITGRDFLIYFSCKYSGDWDKIYEAVSKRERVEEVEFKKMYENLHYKAITIMDDDYPETLKNIFKPPFVLFYDGDISLINKYKSSLAIVGSREPSEYGSTNLLKLVKEVATDFVIVSGCALGTDALAQQECLKNCGKTIGVLGSGIDINYPRTNAFLIEQIRKQGLILSEYPEGTEPIPGNFPIRNRIIVGLSKSVMVFDVRKLSGTQCTASLTCQFDRNLCSIPYPIGTEYINNEFIKDGCYMIEDASDIRFLMSNF